MNRYILEGEYLEIIAELLGEKYKVNSLIKLVFMSFCIRNEKKGSYGTRKKDYVDAFLDNINVKFISHPEEVEAILEVVLKLKTSGWIKFLNGCKDKQINPIREVNKLDSRAFAEEVLRHV